MDQNRKAWNDRHKQLHIALEKTTDRTEATRLFLDQHAAVHSLKNSRSGVHSFNDEILNDLTESAWRFIPGSDHHSIAWVIWHLARIEDVTMNLLIADDKQILHEGNWRAKLRIDYIHTGNGMSDADIAKLSKQIDINALQGYRQAVGRKTRKIVPKLKAEDYKMGVDPGRVERIWQEGAMMPKAKVIVKYWAGRTIAGLLLMPPTRHCFLHLNEARRIKAKAVKKGR